MKSGRRIYLKRKLSIIIMILLISSLVFSGCFNKNLSIDFNSDSLKNNYPTVVIDAPKQAYFRDNIEFDATGSYDSDGDIVSYYWLFGDGETAQGNIVTHSYSFENNLYLNYPLIYTYSLLIVDDKGAKIVRSNEIMLYPNKYQLFLKSGGFDLEKPSFSEDYIKTSLGEKSKNPSKVLHYELSKPINLTECNWNITLSLKKPLLTRLSKIKIAFFDRKNNEISYATKNFEIFRFWNRKIIELNGKIVKNSEFQKIKIFFYGFSLRNKISVVYGSDLASNICFNFKN